MYLGEPSWDLVSSSSVPLFPLPLLNPTQCQEHSLLLPTSLSCRTVSPSIPAPPPPRTPLLSSPAVWASKPTLTLRYDMESTDNGAPSSEKSKPLEQSVEDLSKGPPASSAPQPRSRHLTVKYVGPMAG